MQILNPYSRFTQGRRMCWTQWSASFAIYAPPNVGTSYRVDDFMENKVIVQLLSHQYKGASETQKAQKVLER